MVDECPFRPKRGHPYWFFSLVWFAFAAYAAYLGVLGWTEQKKSLDNLLRQVRGVGGEVQDAWRLACNVSVSWAASECEAAFGAINGLVAQSNAFEDEIARQAINSPDMLTMLACDQTLQDQLNKTGRYTAELQRLVAEQQAIVCSAAQQPLPSLPTWAIPDVCSAAKAAIGDIDNIDIQNRLLSMLNGGLEVLVGGRPIVLLHAGLWGLLLLTTLTACESLAWLILLRFHAGRIAKMVIVVTLTCSWLASLIMCVVGIGGFYLLYTLCKTLSIATTGIGSSTATSC